MYDASKDRRYGILFFITFFTCFGFFALAMYIHGGLSRLDLGTSDDQNVFLAMLPGIFILIAAIIWRVICFSRPQPKEKFKRKELSRDEIVKARSKLVKAK